MQSIMYKLTLLEHMLGTVPKDKEIYASYIADKTTPENLAEELATVQEIEEKGWTGFHSDEKGLFIYDYLVKGFLKEAGNVLKEAAKLKNLRSKIDNYVFIFPRKIYLGKMKPDGVLERPLRAMTMQGPRVTLARSDYVNAGTVIDCEIKLLEHKEITPELINTLMGYGELKGLGQFRNGSYGRFSFEVVETKIA